MADALNLLRIYGGGAMYTKHCQAGEDHPSDQVARHDRNLVQKPPVRHINLSSHYHTDWVDKHGHHRVCNPLREEQNRRPPNATYPPNKEPRAIGNYHGLPNHPMV